MGAEPAHGPFPEHELQRQAAPHYPLFPLLRTNLEAAFVHAGAGSEHVIPEEYRRRANGEREWGGANLRLQFGKILRRAGVESWQNRWHSLRDSC